MNKILLSHSTISNCLQPNNSHNWLNKQIGAIVPDNEFFKRGREVHKIIQGHISNKKPNEILLQIKELQNIGSFPIVEERNFDPRCKVIISINEKYEVIMLYDALDPDNLRFGEIKAWGKMWTVGQFQSSMQRKMYVLGKPTFTKALLITALPDPKQWLEENPRVFTIPATEQDKKDAEKYIEDAIKVIEGGVFKGGLDENGKCTNRFCYFKENCQFK